MYFLYHGRVGYRIDSFFVLSGFFVFFARLVACSRCSRGTPRTGVVLGDYHNIAGVAVLGMNEGIWACYQSVYGRLRMTCSQTHDESRRQLTT